MNNFQGNPVELRKQFWHAMENSPFVMLQLDADTDSAAPMTAQLDRTADHAIWFFTSSTNRFAAMGPATATFSSKGHDVFVIAHPTPAIGSAGSLTASTKRMVSNTEARLAFAVLTTERKAA